MSRDDPKTNADGSDPTAAEYVLGLLRAEERRVVERRMAREPGLATEVAWWEERFGGLAAAIPAVPPPADGWARIEAALPVPETSRQQEGLLRSLAFWRGLAAASTALAVASLAALIYLGGVQTPGGPLVAQLEAEPGQAGFVAAANPADGSLTILPAALLTGGQQQQAYELWVIPKGGTPHSLGLIDPNRPVKVSVRPELMPHITVDSVLAVTREPLGGSPTGLPTGPVIANGKLASL